MEKTFELDVAHDGDDVQDVIKAYSSFYLSFFGKHPVVNKSKNEEKARQLLKLLRDNSMGINEFFEMFFKSDHKFLKENGYTLSMAVSLFDIVASSYDSQFFGDNKFIAQLDERQRSVVADYFMKTSAGIKK